MKNSKPIIQYVFMTLLLLGVFGIYTELRDLNSQNYSLHSSTQAVKASYSVPEFDNTPLSAGNDIPLVYMPNGKLAGKFAVPVVVLPDTDFRHYDAKEANRN